MRTWAWRHLLWLRIHAIHMIVLHWVTKPLRHTVLTLVSRYQIAFKRATGRGKIERLMSTGHARNKRSIHFRIWFKKFGFQMG